MITFFRIQGPKRPDISGIPYGFWFGWRPRDSRQRFSPTRFKWSVGAFWYPWWRIPFGSPKTALLPRIHFNGDGPLGP